MDARLRRVARAVLLALAIAFVITVVTADGSRTLTGRIGGDYPAFYGAGEIVADGDVDQLYDPARQAAAQAGLQGDDDAYLHFAYPPAVGAAYAPLAQLPFTLSYVVHTLLMLAAMVGGLWLMRPMLPILRTHFDVVVAGTLAFYPMFRAVTAGQNTALSFLLLAWSWRAVHDQRHDQAGLALGLLLFKPQLALMFIGLHGLAHRWRIVRSAVAVGVVWWVAGAILQGAGWLGSWWDQALEFGELDAVVNAANAISWLGVAQTALGVESLVAAGIGWALAAATVVMVLVRWTGIPRRDLADLLAVSVPGALLAAPHAMFYDAGLLALSGVALMKGDERTPRLALAALWVLALAHDLNDIIGFTPLFVVTAGVFALALWARPRPGAEIASQGPPAARPAALSIVIPAFNEAARIGPTLEAVAEVTEPDVEVVVVDDGSTDDTSEVVDRFRALIPNLRLIRLEHNCGKGGAVRVGMLAAVGEWRLMMDADGSTPMAELAKLEAAVRDRGAGVAIGSIAVAQSQVLRRQSGLRPALGRLGNMIIRRLVLPEIHDSQRGFKLFRGDVAADVFSRTRIDGWGFDVEALAIARALGHEVAEVGVAWEHRDDSRVTAASYLQTLGEVLRVRRLVGAPGHAHAPAPMESPSAAGEVMSSPPPGGE